MSDISAGTLALASTIAAAIAALAACAAVGLDVRRNRKSHVPHVSSTPGRPTDGSGPTLAFANAGPGLAIALAYFGVDGGFQFGDGVGAGGHLMPFAEQAVRVALPEWTAKQPTLVHFCRDTQGGLHVWTPNGRYNRSQPKPGNWPTAGENFHKMYPGVPIPKEVYNPGPLFASG